MLGAAIEGVNKIQDKAGDEVLLVKIAGIRNCLGKTKMVDIA